MPRRFFTLGVGYAPMFFLCDIYSCFHSAINMVSKQCTDGGDLFIYRSIHLFFHVYIYHIVSYCSLSSML